MSNYRRAQTSGGTYFITQVTYQRDKWLCEAVGRQALREALLKVKLKYSFVINALVLLPEHFHCLFTLPSDAHDLSVRLRLIKTHVTKHYGKRIGVKRDISHSRRQRKEQNLWQRRFWEHLIRDEEDFNRHCDYIHYNPVHHGLCDSPQDWAFSTVHRFVREGVYPSGWGGSGEMVVENLEFD